MLLNFPGRIGQTAIGDQAPKASTSRPSHCHNYQRHPARTARRAPLLRAQLQQKEEREEKERRARPAKQDNRGLPHDQQAGIDGKRNWLAAKWADTPSQYKLIFACAWAFVICNMDKVNISVAIISMSKDFGWSPTISGVVQSSFFAGYMFTQIPGGYIVSRLTGRRVLPAGVSMWSLATAATPLLAGSLPGMLLCRVLVGLGEGVAPTSATDMVARICKQSERSRAIGFIFSGLHVGSLAGLLVAPVLIETLGWPAVFYMFGLGGLLWSGWWESLMSSVNDKDPVVVEKIEGRRKTAVDAGSSGDDSVPWRSFLRNSPVRALTYVHFCNNWNAYVMTAWLPSYFSNSLSLDLTQASQAALFPPIAAIAASAIAGPAADYVISNGAPVGPVRKIAQAVAFLGPAAFLILACNFAGGSADNEMLTVGLISGALGLASVSVAGLYSNHADLSPRHASILLGLTNTMGAIPGIVGVTLTGIIFDKTRDWNLALFAPSIFFFVTGTLVFALYGSADEQKFDNNEPFGFEKYFQPVVQQASKIPVEATSTSIMERVRALVNRTRNT